MFGWSVRYVLGPSPAVQAVPSASIVAVSMRSATARASSASDVTKASACSWVNATNSASYVVSHPSWSATFHAVRWSTLSPRKRTLDELTRVTRSIPSTAEISPRPAVQRRQRLGADERRRDERVPGRDSDLAGSDPEKRLTVNGESRHALDPSSGISKAQYP